MERLGQLQSPLLSEHERLPDDPAHRWEAKVRLIFEQLDASENTRTQYKREVRPFLRFLRERGLGISRNVHAYRKAFTSKLIESGLNLLEVPLYTRHRDVSQRRSQIIPSIS